MVAVSSVSYLGAAASLTFAPDLVDLLDLDVVDWASFVVPAVAPDAVPEVAASDESFAPCFVPEIAGDVRLEQSFANSRDGASSAGIDSRSLRTSRWALPLLLLLRVAAVDEDASRGAFDPFVRSAAG